MEQDRKTSGRRHGERKEKTARRALAATRPSATNPRLRDAVVSLDAEDIALARLQAHLRRAEAIHSAVLPGWLAKRSHGVILRGSGLRHVATMTGER